MVKEKKSKNEDTGPKSDELLQKSMDLELKEQI
jgi:hypothetical protein